VQQAFGSNLAQELIKTYDGSNLTADSQQDLVGDRYLAKQIEIIQHQQKTSSILDKWSHLLYEGEKEDSSSASASTQQQQRQGIEATSLRVINKSSSYNSLLAKQQQRQIEEQIQHAQLLQQQSQQHIHHSSSTPPAAGGANLSNMSNMTQDSLRHSRSGNNYASVQTLISNQFHNKLESQRQSASEIQSLMETQQISIGSGTVAEDVSRRQSAQTSIGSTALEDELHAHSRRQSMHTSLGSGTIQESRRSSQMDHELSRRQSGHTAISSGAEESSRLHSGHTSAIEESSRRQSGHISNFSSALDETDRYDSFVYFKI
jgi:hypothetical protein